MCPSCPAGDTGREQRPRRCGRRRWLPRRRRRAAATTPQSVLTAPCGTAALMRAGRSVDVDRRSVAVNSTDSPAHWIGGSPGGVALCGVWPIHTRNPGGADITADLTIALPALSCVLP